MSAVVDREAAIERAVSIESLTNRMAGVCLLGSAAIHAVFTRPHLHENVSHGVFFAAVTAVQVVTGVFLLARDNRRVLSASALFSFGVISVWVASRTVGIGGEVEPVGLADTVSSGLEAVVVLAGLVMLTRPGLARRTLPIVPGGAVFGAAAVAVLALSIPSVAGAGSAHHHHQGQLAGHHHDGGQQTGMHHHDHGQLTSSHETGAHHHAGAMSASSMPAGHHQHMKQPCPNPTAAQRRAADKLVRDTKAGTARLADVEVAKAEGYMRFGDGDIAGTWHYINWKYQADSDVLDPKHPESIIYWQASPESQLYLIGAMYITPKAGVAGPQVAGCMTQWHAHGAPFAPEGVDTPEMLHTWLVPLPGGPFVTDPSHPDEL